MPREIHPDLVARLRRADPTARQIVEAQVVENTAAGAPMEHVRSTKDGPAGTAWSAADSLTGLTVFDNGDVRITGSLTTLLSHASGTDEQTDLGRTTPVQVALIELGDAMDAEQEISRISVRLNPRRSASQPREVVTWRMELYRLVDGRGDSLAGVFFGVAPIETPLDVPVTGDSESDVVFDFRSASRQPRPKAYPGVKKNGTYIPDFFSSPTAGVIRVGRHYLLVAVYALNAEGDSAGNVSWDYDSGSASVTSGGHTLRGRRFIIEADGSWRDNDSFGGTPRILIEAGSFSQQVIEFIANPFDVGATPSGDLELVGHGATPRGTSITYEVRNDADSAWVAFEDGDLHSDVGIGKTMPRKMRATLTPNGGGTLSPILKRLGLRAITRKEVLCEVREYEEAFDPETMKVEMNRFGSLQAIRNGPPQDFRSAIEDLLAQHFARHIVFRTYIGDRALPRSKWLHKTDFLAGDWEAAGAGLTLRGLSILAHLKDLVPPYSPGTNLAPDGDQTVGSWTTDAGGGTNLYQRIDEETVDETDYIRSGTSPANQQVVFTLPTPSDFADRRLFVDCEYAKDASGGEQIDLKVQLYQSAVLIAEVTNTDIGPDRVNGTMELTEQQRQAITDPANLRLAFSANAPSPGTGRRALVFWARFRTGGRREVVTYANETLKDVCDDLVDNRLALESRYRGPLIESTAYTVSKQLTGIRGRNPDGKDIVGKAELEALGKLAGGIIHEKQGRIVFTDVFGAKPVAAEFPASRIELGPVGPGLERRVPEFFVGYRYDPTLGEFQDEARAVHENSLLRIGRVGLGAPKWEDETVAQWIDSDGLAAALAVRTVESFGTGLMLWSFTSIDPYPELHIGDLVAVETTKFVNRDPNTAREVRGRLWVTGVITRADFWGRRFTVWVRNVADIKVPTQQKPPSDGRRKPLFYVRGRELAEDVYVAAAKRIRVGTVASPSEITKTIRFHHAAFVPERNTTSWLYTNTLIRPNTAAALQFFWAPVVLPKGVTIIAVRMRAYRQTAGTDTASIQLMRIASDAATTLATVTHDTTGWQTKEATGLSQLVGDDSYSVFLSLFGNGNGGLDARLQYVEIDYTVPDYLATY